MHKSTKKRKKHETYFIVLAMLSEAHKRKSGMDFTALNHYDLMVMIDGGVKFADFKTALDQWLESSANDSPKTSGWADIREVALFTAATRLDMLEEEN
jgi:hypothetical protein